MNAPTSELSAAQRAPAAPVATPNQATAAKERRGPSKLRRLVPLLVLGAIAGAFFAYRYVQSHRPYEWSGTIEARDISVGSRAGGRVKKVLVREGDRVTPEQPLIELEPGDLEAQKLVAQGQLLQAEANLERLKNGARPEELLQAKARSATAVAALDEVVHGARNEDVAQARARLVAAQATVDKAEIDAARAKQLVLAGAATQADLDAAEAGVKSARALRDAQQHALDSLQNGSRREDVSQAKARADEAKAMELLVVSGPRVEDIKAADGAVTAARGRLEQIDVLLRELVIKAPVAARVESLDLRPGDLLAPSAAAARLLEDDQVFLRIYVPETQLGFIHIGDEVPVTVDSFPDKAWKGVVEHVNNVGEYSPRNLQTADERADQVFAARIGLAEGADVLRAGMAAFIRVPR